VLKILKRCEHKTYCELEFGRELFGEEGNAIDNAEVDIITLSKPCFSLILFSVSGLLVHIHVMRHSNIDTLPILG
jgi:hypothetical protein